MSSFNLVLNNKNVIGTTNNTFTYTFINGSFTIPEKSKMCVSSCTIPYSFFNVSQSQYNNASFGYTFGEITYNYIMPDGFYTAIDINNFLKVQMIKNGTYLIDSSNLNNVYYCNINTDSNYYSNQILCYVVPISLPSGFSVPNNFPGFPKTAMTSQFIVGTNESGSLLGYVKGIYPPTNTAKFYNTIGSVCPNASPINAIIIHCSLIDNRVAMPLDILDSFAINSTFGSNINYQPTFRKDINLTAGKFHQMTVYFTDQNNNLLPMRDSNILLNLLITFNI